MDIWEAWFTIETLLRGFEPDSGQAMSGERLSLVGEVEKELGAAHAALTFFVYAADLAELRAGCSATNPMARAGAPWSEAEYDLLLEALSQNVEVGLVAKVHARSSGEISAFLNAHASEVARLRSYRFDEFKAVRVAALYGSTAVVDLLVERQEDLTVLRNLSQQPQS